jgi:uncharacterized protein (TIGR02246 family)
MRKILKLIPYFGFVFYLSIGSAGAGNSHMENQIKDVLSQYQTALNNSNVDAAVALYAKDGVFMAQHSKPAEGLKAIRTGYENVFKAITLSIEFSIDEIKELSSGWAYARTQSDGFVTINQTGDKAPEANQELFIFHQNDEKKWQIYRYIFSTTNPPRA